MEKTILDIHRNTLGLEHDGEAVLTASRHSFFSCGPIIEPFYSNKDRKGIGISSSTMYIFDQLGLKSYMTRDEIIQCLNGHLEHESEMINSLIQDERELIRRRVEMLYRNIYPLEGEDLIGNATREIARKRVVAIIRSAISFCEDLVPAKDD